MAAVPIATGPASAAVRPGRAAPGAGRPIVSPPSMLRPDGSVLARDVRDFWGVCIDTVGEPAPDVVAGMLERIGTRRIRCPVVLGGVSRVPHWRSLQAAMMSRRLPDPHLKVLALVGAYMNDPLTTPAKWQAELLKAVDLLYAIEGPNEYNNVLAGNGTHGPYDVINRTGNFPPLFLEWCQALNAWWRATPSLAGVMLAAPSLAIGAQGDAMRLANVSSLVHLGNVHFYAGRGQQPSLGLPRADTAVGSDANVVRWTAKAQMGGKATLVSECGATNDGKNYARDGVSQAKYIANQLFDFAKLGVQQMYLYKLIDDSSQAGDTEGNFGLFRTDGSAKPAAEVLARIQQVLSLDAHTGPANLADNRPFAPGFDAPRLEVSGGDVTRQSLVLPKSDGSTVIAVWNETQIDDGHGNSLDPPPQSVTLGFGSRRGYRVHDILAPRKAGDAPFTTGSGVQLALRGYPLLVELARQ